MSKIYVAIVGLVFCAFSLIQGIQYYHGKRPEEAVGLMHWDIGGYSPSDIEVCDGETVNFTPPGCTDNCGDCTVTCTRDDGLGLGDAYPVGATVITCHADDNCPNRTTCTTTVTVNPNPSCSIDAPTEAGVLTGSIFTGRYRNSVRVAVACGDRCSVKQRRQPRRQVKRVVTGPGN